MNSIAPFEMNCRPSVTFQHANLRTPYWLGYLIQRPESHSVRHQRGVDAFNYGDIALWDMLFGTWCNPREWDEQAGFYDGGSRRIVPMLLGRDIHATPDVRVTTN